MAKLRIRKKTTFLFWKSIFSVGPLSAFAVDCKLNQRNFTSQETIILEWTLQLMKTLHVARNWDCDQRWAYMIQCKQPLMIHGGCMIPKNPRQSCLIGGFIPRRGGPSKCYNMWHSILDNKIFSQMCMGHKRFKLFEFLKSSNKLMKSFFLVCGTCPHQPLT